MPGGCAGHFIEPAITERRCYKGIRNLFNIYLLIADGALIVHNLEGKRKLIAQKVISVLLAIINQLKFNASK